MRCAVCKHGELVDEKIDYQTKINGKYILVKNVKAQVCNICGEQFLSYETAKEIEAFVFEHKKPSSFVNVPVYEIAG